MPKSEAAKALAEKQRAERKALKERKKNSSDPKDWGTLRQIKETFKVTSSVDKQLVPITIAVLAIPTVVFVIIGCVVGLVFKQGWMWIITFGLLGFMIGFYLATWQLRKRAVKASFAKYKGQAGSAELALSMLNQGKKKLWQYSPVIAFTKQQDVVHRVVGPAGLILIGEGESGRVKQLLATEVKRHEQIAYGVTCQTLLVGDKPGQIPLEQLEKHIKKMPKQWDAVKVDEVAKRLQALDNVRQRLPMPKGPMPTTKGSRSTLRGR